MPQYTFKLTQGERNANPGVTSNCSNDAAARTEAAGIFVDVARDVARDLETNPQWRMEVTDEFGKPIFRLSVHAESMD
jgi:hypothetical protein